MTEDDKLHVGEELSSAARPCWPGTPSGDLIGLGAEDGGADRLGHLVGRLVRPEP